MFVQACLCRNPDWKFITLVYTIDGVSFKVYECQGCNGLRFTYIDPKSGNGEDK